MLFFFLLDQRLSFLEYAVNLDLYLSVHHLKQLHNIPSLRRLKLDIHLLLDPETLAYPEPLADAHLGDLHITKLHSLNGIGCELMREICNITTLRKLTVGVTCQASTLVGICGGGFLFSLSVRFCHNRPVLSQPYMHCNKRALLLNHRNKLPYTITVHLQEQIKIFSVH
jgi:hypothetical protein